MIEEERNSKAFMDERKRKIWIMNLLRNGVSNFEFCHERGIVGFGWGLLEHTTTDYDEFKELTKLEGHYYKNGKYNDNLNIAMRYFDEMNPGDLILLHDKNMKFYVCVVLDEPKINQGALYFEANVTCNRKVEFLSKAINEEELRNLGVEPRNCIARHTIEKLVLPPDNKLSNYMDELCLSWTAKNKN